MIYRPLLNRVLTKNAAHVAHVAMIAAVPAQAPTVLRLAAVRVVPHWVATLRLPMAAISLQRPLVPMQINPPLSASAR
jgi:hypothetical protein